MHTLKTRQTIFNSVLAMECNFLKFCYFLLTMVLLSCNNGSTTKEIVETNTPTTTETANAQEPSKKTILFFGDSITAGYGLDDSTDAYPGLIQNKIDSLGLKYVVVNSGLSGETTAGGLSRIKWVLNQEIDVFLLELGANDGLRGVPLAETRANLQAIIDAVRIKSPNTTIVLAGMELPPNMGHDYTSEFKSIFSDLAKKNELAFIPFILKDVGGIAALNQNDGIHPTINGHKIVANTVWEIVEPLINI